MMRAEDLTLALGGRWHRRYGTAPCPVCQPERRRGQDALTLTDGHGGLLVHCKRTACDFRNILGAAGVTPGSHTLPNLSSSARRKAERRADAERRAGQAHRLWREAFPIGGTVAETYLRKARRITCVLPSTLRFHPACWHGATASRHPALVALIEGSDDFAVHRTYLRPDGSGKAALDPPKAMLGATSGGAVRLTDAGDALVVAEGIETALSLACGLLHGPASIWAALSTSGLRGLRLPPMPGRLTIACDGDAPGRDAAHALAERASALGWRVSLLPAPEGRDWNDILTMKGDQ